MTHEFSSASSSTHSSTCFNGGLKTATAAAKDGQNSDAFLDRLARLAIAELMQKEEFQKIWIQKAIELEEMEIKARQEEAEKSEKEIPARLILDLRRRSLHSDEYHSPQCHPEDPQKSNTPSNRPNPLFAQQFGQLAQRLELAIEAFLGGTQLAYSSASVDCGFSDRKRFSREAASFYSVRIQLERFCSSGRLHPAQFGLVAHIIGKLQQIFASFVSIPYSVEKATFLANTLFQMLGQLLEYCLLFEQINELAEVAWLRRTLKQFGIKVCRRLNKLLQSTQNKRKSSPVWPTSAGRSTTPPGKLQRSTSLRCLDVAMANKRVVLIPFKLKQPSQQKGFLLSPELNYERARMPGRAERSKSSKNIKYLSAQGEDLLLGGIRTGEEKEELRKACRLAREMIEKIAGRVDRK